MHTPTLTPGVAGGVGPLVGVWLDRHLFIPSRDRKTDFAQKAHTRSLAFLRLRTQPAADSMPHNAAARQPKKARLSNNLGWRVLTGAARKGHSYRTIFGGHPTTHVCDSCTLWGLQPLKFVAVSHGGASSPLISRQFHIFGAKCPQNGVLSSIWGSGAPGWRVPQCPSSARPVPVTVPVHK